MPVAQFSRQLVSRKLIECLVIVALTCVPVHSAIAKRAAIIDSIAPPAGREGDLVTIHGRGFGASNVSVTVGEIPASVVSAKGNSVTFRIPAGVAGATTVAVTNPGCHRGQIAFRVLEGVLLQGPSSALATSVLLDRRPVGVDAGQIQDHVILTRLDVRLTTAATTAQVNAALLLVQGGVVSMVPGHQALTIAVPHQSSARELEAAAHTLRAQPGIQFAAIGREMAPMIYSIPPPAAPLTPGGVAVNAHLLPTGFSAAWNAHSLLQGCQKVTFLIPDTFGAEPPQLSNRLPVFQSASPAPGALTDLEKKHGYENALLAAARFDGTEVTGANPFSDCLDLKFVQVAGLTVQESAIEISANFPSGRFILNFSLGYNDDCVRLVPPPDFITSDCRPPLDSTLLAPIDRAYDALAWKELTRHAWSRSLMTTSAGNSRDAQGTPIYPGMGDSRFTNMLAIAAQDDPHFQFVGDPDLWAPSVDGVTQGFATLVADPTLANSIAQEVIQMGVEDVADNVLVVGSTSTLGCEIDASGGPDHCDAPRDTLLSAPLAESLHESLFSEARPDVMAVGEHLFDTDKAGTSSAAPQVAGLASYLWLLSPTLRQAPPSVTRSAIVANRFEAPGMSASGLINAYATVLSLDAATIPSSASAPVRRAILDLDGLNGFDETDIAAFLSHVAPAGIVGDPLFADFSRWDLNGDGFTGGPGLKAAFDLDRVGSTQFGATDYSSVQQNIEGVSVTFDETALSDLEILCYYAYSPMYEGDSTARSTSLLGQCAKVNVTVSPAGSVMKAGGTLQFVATVSGAADPRVTWSATGGTIDSSGLFSAGSTAGSFLVQATSVADPQAFANATITINVPNSQCGAHFYKELRLGNHTDSITFDYEDQPGTFSESLPGPFALSSGTVDLRSATVSASDPDFRTTTSARGATGVAAGATFLDFVTLMPFDSSLIGRTVTFDLAANVTALLGVTGDHAIALWSASFSSLSVGGRVSTIVGRSSGDPSGGSYSVTVPAILGTPLGVGGSLTVAVGVDSAPNESPIPPLDFTGSGHVTASAQLVSITNIRDEAGHPLSVSICSAGGSW